MKKSNFKQVLILLRPHQWIKNIFIFCPMFFSFSFDQEKIISLSYAFILFSMLASSVYIFNDLMDITEDRNHPTKKKRPLASGAINVKNAIFLLSTLSGISLLLTFLFNQALFFVFISYFILNILYSIKLKHISIVDVTIISLGFVLRLFAGSVVINVDLSMWIIIMTFLLALFLALAKRRDDVLLNAAGKEVRKNIDGYNLELVDALLVLMSGIIILSYIMYTVSPEVMARHGTEYLYLTAFFVMLGFMRYLQITLVEKKSGSPTKIVLTDHFIQIDIVLWIISFALILGTQ